MPATSQYDRPASYYMNQGVDGQPLPTISDRLRSMGMDSSVENRPMLMPIREEGEWTAPEWFHSMARGAMVPAQAVLGGTVTPLDTAMATADYTGGGLLSSKAIPNAVPDGSVLGATVWHGSPHKFDKFDMSQIGTGEGVQAYGHGLYFADHPDVAKGYAQALSRPHPDDQYKEILKMSSKLGTGLDSREASYLESSMNHLDWNTNEIFDDFLNYAPEWKGTDESSKKGIKKLIDQVKNQTNLGHKYKVDLPDEHIDKMLDWDKPLSEQPESVRKALEANNILGGFSHKNDYGEVHKGVDYFGRVKDRLGSLHFKKLRDEMSLNELGGGLDEATSKYLNNLGITGIKYLDQGSRGAGKGTSNYVVFDDTLPTILGRE